MGHFIYPAGTPLGTVPFGYVVPHTDWQTTIQQVFKSLNADDGGAWAPVAFITIGGAGFQWTSATNELADHAVITVKAGGEIHIEDNPFAPYTPGIRVAGASGEIQLYVSSSNSFLDAQSGSFVRILGGAALDVLGTMTLNSAGPGMLTAGSGTSITLQSGAQIQLSVGSTGSVFSNWAIKSGAFLTVESGGTISLAGNMSVGAASTVTYIVGSTIAGTITSTATITQSGNTGRIIKRYAVLPDANSDITVANDILEVPATLLTDPTYIVRHTAVGFIPKNGEMLRIFRSRSTTVSTHFAYIRREDNTPLYIFANDHHGWIDLVYSEPAAEWRLCGWSALINEANLAGTGLYGL